MHKPNEHDKAINYGLDGVGISFGLFIIAIGTIGLAILMGAI